MKDRSIFHKWLAEGDTPEADGSNVLSALQKMPRRQAILTLRAMRHRAPANVLARLETYERIVRTRAPS